MILSSFCLAFAAAAGAIEFDRLRPADFLWPVSAGVEALPSPGTVVVSPKAQPTTTAPAPLSGRFTVAPDAGLTPGVLCTTQDKDFVEFRYSEKIPYCKRNVTTAEKQEVSRWYGVRWEDHGLYQYDHLLSLCLGGSNDLRNIWPMLWDEARKKALMEANLCLRLKQGTTTQKEAVAEELSWFKENRPALLPRIIAGNRWPLPHPFARPAGKHN